MSAVLAPGWHAGERALQARAGVERRMADLGARVLRDHMPQQHRDFFPLLPFLVAGSINESGQPRISLLSGAPGFAHSPHPQRLRMDVAAGARGFADEDLRADAPVGLLGLQAHTGRRNRMNGWVEHLDEGGLEVRVGQSFGNCPKYIHPREALYAPADAPARATPLGPALDAAALALVAAADTFFIATAHPDAAHSENPVAGVDVSHRGGLAGFVRARDASTLLVPDYVGNSFFNTLGNLQLEPRCALLFVDFASGERLHLQALGEVLWDGPERAALPGALRVLRLQVTHVLRIEGGLPLRWSQG